VDLFKSNQNHNDRRPILHNRRIDFITSGNAPLLTQLWSYCKRDHPANFLHFTRTLTDKFAY